MWSSSPKIISYAEAFPDCWGTLFDVPDHRSLKAPNGSRYVSITMVQFRNLLHKSKLVQKPSTRTSLISSRRWNRCGWPGAPGQQRRSPLSAEQRRWQKKLSTRNQVSEMHSKRTQNEAGQLRNEPKHLHRRGNQEAVCGFCYSVFACLR